METSTAAQTALGATALAAGVAAAAAPAASADLSEELTASADVEIVSESHEFTESAGASEAAEENDAQEIVDKTNDIRAAHGLGELTPSEELTEGFEQWAQVMSSTNTVEHAEGGLWREPALGQPEGSHGRGGAGLDGLPGSPHQHPRPGGHRDRRRGGARLQRYALRAALYLAASQPSPRGRRRAQRGGGPFLRPAPHPPVHPKKPSGLLRFGSAAGWTQEDEK